MQHAFLTMVNKTAKMAKQVDEEAIQMKPTDSLLEDAVLYIPSYTGLPIDDHFRAFTRANSYYIKAIVAIGNVNFGNDFCRTGIELSEELQVPLLDKVDYPMKQHNIDRIREGVKQFDKQPRTVKQ